ncbi:MAG TPA: hypothetical protein VIK69_04965 [Methylophilaceae bacterium]
MISFLLSGPGRRLAGALVAVLVVAGAYIKGRSDGAALCEARYERSNTDARNKADDARRRAEREFDRDGVQPDGWQRD